MNSITVSLAALLCFLFLFGCGHSESPPVSTQSAETYVVPAYTGPVPPAPSAPGQDPSFAYIQQNILKPKCDLCHSAAMQYGGLNVDSYQAIIQSGFATPSKPLTSWIYVETSFGYMPQGGPELTSDETADIYTWILNGAQNN